MPAPETALRGCPITRRGPSAVRGASRQDVLICYLTERSTYVGLLRVIGEPFRDTTPILASQVCPSRLPVHLEFGLRPDVGVPVHSLADRLSYFQNLINPHAWTGYFRGSPATIKPEDAALITTALREAAADPSTVLDLAHLPEPTPKRRRSRQLAAPSEPGIPAGDAQTPVNAAVQRPPTVCALESDEEILAKRLVQAATASEDAATFETALADALAFLGFRTERRSGPGDTDVLAVAPLREDTYVAVVDGKASRQGRVGNAQIDWSALERHKDRQEADHILIVAAGFSGGELARDDERSGAALLTAGDLAEGVRMHATTPFTLPALRDLFRYPGTPDLPQTRMREHATETRRLQQLLPDIVDAIEEAYRYELYDPVNADALLLPLASRRRGRAYSREEVTAALELRCVSQLGILQRIGEGRYTLRTPDAAEWEGVVSNLRAALGEEAFEVASAEGRALSFDAAVAWPWSRGRRSAHLRPRPSDAMMKAGVPR
jgi:hypothetical protein